MKESKPTRANKRAEKEWVKYKEKVSVTSGMDYDENSHAQMSNFELSESLLGAAAEIQPIKGDPDNPVSKKYKLDPKTGDKIRNHKNETRSKSERKKERSMAFWDKI